MNPNEEQFFLDLATKVIAKRATTEEVRKFEVLLSQSSEHRERFETFKTDVVVAKDILTLVSATEAKGSGLTPAQFSRLEKELNELAKKRRWLIGFGILTLLVIGILIYTRSNRIELLTSDDIATPDGIIVTTINALNNR
jgi:hypothetical protein